MRANKNGFIFCFTKHVSRLAVAVTLLLTSVFAQAVFIDFDDIPRVTTDGCFCDHPLSDEWLSQGILVGGYLAGYTDEEGNNHNSIFGGPDLWIRFVGELPVFVSMNVSANDDQSVGIDVYGANGFYEFKATNGWRGLEENSTPYEDNQLVSFEAPGGISYISLGAFYGLRVGAFADNLTFEYASVPEPSALLLFALGLFGLAAAARRRQHAVVAQTQKS